MIIIKPIDHECAKVNITKAAGPKFTLGVSPHFNVIGGDVRFYLQDESHDPKAFEVGDRVKVVRRVEAAKGWSNGWVSEMDATIGEEFEIRDKITDGFRCGIFWYPSCALELVTRSKIEVAKIEAQIKELQEKLENIKNKELVDKYGKARILAAAKWITKRK